MVLLAWADQVLKQAPHAGFCPPNAAVTLRAPDFPAFLAALNRSGGGAALEAHWPKPQQDLALAVRRMTGIRPTASRWSVWLGAGVLAARGGESAGMGICTRPGVVAWAAHGLNRMLGGHVGGGIYRYGPFYYAWHDGYLIISRTQGYLRAARAADPTPWREAMAHDEVRLDWTGAGGGRLTLGGAEGWRVSGRIAHSVTPRRRPLYLTNAWPESPVMSLNASRAADVSDLVATVTRAVAAWPPIEHTALADLAAALYAQAVQAWPLDALPDNWEARSAECALALRDLDISLPLPVPDLAFVLQAPHRAEPPHPLAPLLDDALARPYDWHGSAGVAQPWLGERLTLCLATDESNWIATSNVRSMGRLAGHMRQRAGVRADAVLQVDWTQVGPLAEEAIGNAAKEELIPGMDRRDADYRLAPAAQALGHMGRLQVAGEMRGDHLVFRGHLALGAEEAAP